MKVKTSNNNHKLSMLRNGTSWNMVWNTPAKPATGTIYAKIKRISQKKENIKMFHDMEHRGTQRPQIKQYSQTGGTKYGTLWNTAKVFHGTSL